LKDWRSRGNEQGGRNFVSNARGAFRGVGVPPAGAMQAGETPAATGRSTGGTDFASALYIIGPLEMVSNFWG
jgi:hypothetical protein